MKTCKYVDFVGWKCRQITCEVCLESLLFTALWIHNNSCLVAQNKNYNKSKITPHHCYRLKNPVGMGSNFTSGDYMLAWKS